MLRARERLGRAVLRRKAGVLAPGITGLALALCIGFIATCGGSGDAAGSAAEERRIAGVEVTLELDRTDLVIGETTRLVVRVRNTSSSPLDTPDLARDPAWPQLHLVNVSTGARAVFGPMDAAGPGESPLIPPPPDARMTLAPGQVDTLEATLTQRVRIEQAGSYRLEAAVGIDGRTVTSPAVDLRIAPLELRSCFLAGAHSGPGAFQNILWSQAEPEPGGGSILFLTTMSVDPEGQPFIVETARLDRTESTSLAVLSVSPNGEPFPGKWIFWLERKPDALAGEGTVLRALYSMHGQVEQRLPAQPLDTRSNVLIGPALHDFDREDASRPGTGEAVLWSDLDGRALLHVRTARPDGSIGEGPSFDAEHGKLVWGSAAFLAGGERRVVLAVEGPHGLLMQLARWTRGASGRERTSVMFRLDGSLIGSGATLTAQDELLGATLTRRPHTARQPYTLHLWKLGRDGRSVAAEPVRFDLHGGIGSGQTVIGQSSGGEMLALVPGAGKGWMLVDRRGRSEPLDPDLAALGNPVGILWPSEVSAVVVLASAERGLSVRRISWPPHGRP